MSNSKLPFPGTPSGSASGLLKKTVLSDRFLLGEELGRGAYGQVYKGVDTTNGDVVAIKQIALGGVTPENLQSVMGEIELLKTLNHKNIVKYLGSFKTRTHLYIILEYMENGSLASVIKPNRYGVLTETLAAAYIGQVLQGLQYLHDQGVVHRDIKGANILTTSEGVVKLADFGVAAKLGELDDKKDQPYVNVAGTPYWMAPEVIELTQVTSGADIWSVGCLIIELLTGYPPYYDLQPMSALFRIVQDDHPVLPEGVSADLHDFLLKCFQKDPTMRPAARDLLQHEWLSANKRTLRSTWSKAQAGARTRTRTTDAHESVNSVVARILAADDTDDENVPLRPASRMEESAAAGTRALSRQASSSSIGAEPVVAQPSPRPGLFSRSTPSASPRPDGIPLPRPQSTEPPQQQQQQQRSEHRRTPSMELAVPLLPSSVAASHQQQQEQQPQPQGMQKHDSSSSIPPPPGLKALRTSQSQHQQQQQQQQQQAAASTPNDAEGLLAAFMARLAAESSSPPSSAKFGAQQNLSSWLDEPDSAQHPERSRPSFDPFSTFLTSRDASPAPSFTAAAGDTAAVMEAKRKVRDLVRSMRPGARDANMTPAQACTSLALTFSRQPEARQYFVAEGGMLAVLELLDSEANRVLEPAMDLINTFIGGDSHNLQMLCMLGLVPAVSKYALPPWPATLRMKASYFIEQLCASQVTLQMFVACHGLRVLVLMVDAQPQQTQQVPQSEPSVVMPAAVECIWRVLTTEGIMVLNSTCRILAQCGLVGRLFGIIRHLTAPSSKTRQQPGGPALQQGLKAAFNDLASEPERSGASNRTSTQPLIAAAQGGTSYNGFASSSSYTREPLSAGAMQSASSMTADGPGSLSRVGTTMGSSAAAADRQEQILEKCVMMLLAFSRADAVVKGYMCTRDCLQALLDSLQRLPQPHLTRMLKALRWLSSEATVIPSIKEAGAIPALVPLLAKEREAAAGAALPKEALHALYNICQLNKRVHLELAATANLVPHLCRISLECLAEREAGVAVAASRSIKQQYFRSYVVALLIGMVSTSSSTRAKLWAGNGLDIFLQLLSDEDAKLQTSILRALDTWLAEDHNRVEARLTQRDAAQHLVECFKRTVHPRDETLLPQVLEVLRLMMGRSPKLAVALATGGITQPLLDALWESVPILKARILEVIRCLYEHIPRPKEYIMLYRLQDHLRRILESNVRGEDAVRNEAQRLIHAFNINILL